MMLDDMIKQYPDLGIPPEDAKFIKALIAGAKKRCPYVGQIKFGFKLCVDQWFHRDEKGFLFEIVANKRNGLDVDKCVSYSPLRSFRTNSCCRFDYIQRDSIAVGERGNLSLSR